MMEIFKIKKIAAKEEYERTPVPDSELKGSRGFLGMYAGEHAAGTEFVIGPLFVAHGVAAGDLLLGLLIGNLLAVLSWGLITAPIAVKKRLTLYYQLERIAGKKVVRWYNLVNALMFCFLAGSMIAVSATAVGIPFDLEMPTLSDWFPRTPGWIVTVVLMGGVITLVAIQGYDKVSKFANVMSPWMILIFFAAGIVGLSQLGVGSGEGLFAIAQEVIWNGVPLPGMTRFSIWHVIFFAWFCNMAMHIGMSDLTILRYAKSWTSGFAVFAGLYLGHFVAWIASGILYAVFLQANSGSQEFAPGPIAYQTLGIAGAICVVVAGWTTANPTIYRAGLALQGIFPKVPTWKITAIVGGITSIAACFPALVMKLLDFVALYGLLLMPMGAVIFADFYLSKRMGFRSEAALNSGSDFSLPALLSWVLTLAFCLGLNLIYGVEIFFLGLPGWFVAVAIFIALSKMKYPVSKPLVS
ncbi:membrane protein [Algoriphagus vanfongensis]|uniref:membrane protein n=1 Tax=Algoriphagus vanfongensis TaxID=426371 RepID=UPI00047975E3